METLLIKNLKKFALFIMISGGVSALTIQDASARWYQVNVVIFKQPGYIAQHEQFFPKQNVSSKIPANAVRLKPDAADQSRNFRLHKITDKEFKTAANRLRNSKAYKVVFNKSWVQKGLSKNSAKPVIIEAGKNTNGHYEIEGTLRLHASKFLHMKTNLRIARDINNLSIPADSSATDNDIAATNLASGNANPADTLNAGQYTMFKQSRRMKRNELHYIDHPLFGMLVKVVAIQ